MFPALKRFLKTVVTGEADDLTFAEDDHRLAAAALLVHIIAVDGVVDDAEREMLSQVLRTTYQLTPEMTTELIEAATKRDAEAVDLYGFTSVLKRTLDIDGRLKVLEMMWELVYADGTVHEFEDNTIWRVAELMGISSRERLALRRKVAAHTHVDSGDADEGEAS
ncbi:TerB family tellurite resistance protein [Stappia sp.]|jgi:uncharacterized tellurite resistance protein B-like protein|uniref:tellurite resistance TerB family protein n=1 Tax=Stappia sp. TaxID=1870903 RepID=UPI003A9996C9